MLLLGGHDINKDTWKAALTTFWDDYLKTPSSDGHPMLEPGAPPRDRTVALYIHGDEGRGKKRLPIMIQAIQPVVSYKGPDFKNSSGPLTSTGI